VFSERSVEHLQEQRRVGGLAKEVLRSHLRRDLRVTGKNVHSSGFALGLDYVNAVLI
jgi:hypothetical protein